MTMGSVDVDAADGEGQKGVEDDKVNRGGARGTDRDEGDPCTLSVSSVSMSTLNSISSASRGPGKA
jgi:hypothetical protein